jgi:hypothetical protein
MLRLGGYINIIIAIGHIVGLLWAVQMFEVTGIGKEMGELSTIHYLLPYLLTISVAIVFFIFGLYGLSADNKFRQLPFLKPIILLIAGIFILRGFGGLITYNLKNQNSISQTIYSIIAIFIGIIYLVGGLKKYRNI